MDSAIIVSIISVIGSFVLVYLSTIKETFERKYQVRKEQLDKFYIPFYQMYCRGFMSQIKFSDFPMETKLEFLDMLSTNIYLLEPKSQSLYPQYYRSLLDLMEAEDGNPDFPLDTIKNNFDTISQQLISQILNEYKHILKKCRLPVPSI